MRRLYWEVNVPRGRRVFGDVDGFVGEYRWQRSGVLWSRVCSLDTSELAGWIGVSPPANEFDEENRYLFSAIDPPGELELSAPRLSTVVLWASGMSLVAGLLLINLPAMRHPGVLWVCVVVVVACSVMYVELAILLAQASMLGIALVIVAAMLERFFALRRQAHRPRTADSSALAGRHTSRPRFGPLLTGGSDSTQTSPVAAAGSSHGADQ
ncbi:MAG: hypothetical protein R3C10_14440 [Pirellulales bacterium]